MTVLPKPPYPSLTRAQGWRQDLDYQVIDEWDVWALLDGVGQAWLLKLLYIAWKQVPTGTLPEDRQLIAARLGVSSDEFARLADLLLRDWVKHADGRLYHPLLIESVLRMLKKREGNRERQDQIRQRDRVVRPRVKQEENLEAWLATLPQERAQALRDELDGAQEARHGIGIPLSWAKAVDEQWNRDGKVHLHFGVNVQERRQRNRNSGAPTNDEEYRKWVAAGVKASVDVENRKIFGDQIT